MIDAKLEEAIRKAVVGFPGVFKRHPDEDDFCSPIVYVDVELERHTITETLDDHVAEPLVVLLNAPRDLLAEVDQLRDLMRKLRARVVAYVGGSLPTHLAIGGDADRRDLLERLERLP